jgi:acetylornithine deacetylase/succinyl-diaminopimelate desuccinylase-like protein
MARLIPLFSLATIVSLSAQSRSPIDWAQVDAETMQHFQALLRFDTTDPPTTPPGVEKPAVEYLKQVLDKEGIPTQVYALEPNRPNLIARLRGSGKAQPLLIMAHTDTVNIDPKKWTFPPFSATRDAGYVYGRGAVDDKDNVTSALMTLLLLKRNSVQLDRDVIVLFEAGEEGATRVGIQFIASQHYADIDAEYCLAEGGNGTRERGQMKFVSVQTLEKIPRAISLTARGVAGHGSVPLQSNAIVHLSGAVANVAKWQPPIRPNETTAAYFKRLATVSTAQEAERYRNVLSPDPKISGAADEYLRANEPRHASMLRTSISPNMFQGGYRVNVIPSEAVATLDVRMLPDEDPAKLLEEVKRVVNDPSVEVAYTARDVRPNGTTRLNTDAFAVIETNVKKHYNTITLPTMSTGATDMAYLRAKGMQCYGIGPALDAEDGPKGFGAHSDQERILESELYRFVRFNYDVVVGIAGSR